ncbi:hypothetical protein BUALT_Bualt12G0023000 [Buddleja alternifolia]|uniref:Uncharacterized protein n=1 Tax=Buddleja alternifolia TaxID=168488 RepID=A0AAV6WWH3_9LAMI|nr:hypothetical protein BUALT_Bualt12G0023000 [Buddleja alternifolia]
MSPPGTIPDPTIGIVESDCPSSKCFETSQTFDFSANLIDAAGFSYSRIGTEKSNLSRRSKPRLTKMRRKQMVACQNGKSVNVDLGLNGFGDVSSGIKFESKLGNVFGGSNGDSGSNGSAKNGDLSGSMEQFGDSGSGGLGFGVSLNDSLPGSSLNSSTHDSYSKDCDFLFASSKGSSNLNGQKETGTYVFSACKSESDCVFGPNKSGLRMDSNLENGHFVFGVDESVSGLNSNFSTKESSEKFRQLKVDDFQKFDKFENHDSASRVKLEQQETNKPGWHFSVDAFGKVNSANFVFSACENESPVINSDSQKQDFGKNMVESESGMDAGNTVPDMRGKIKLDTSGDSEKVCYPFFQFQSNRNESSSSKNHVNFVVGSSNNDSQLGVGLKNNSAKCSFANSSKENTEVGVQFQNACLNGVFVFGGLKGKGVLDSSENTKPVNGGKAEDYNGFEESDPNIGSDVKLSGGLFEEDPLSKLSNEMKRLNIEDSEADANKAQNVTTNSSVNIKNMFVFGSEKKNYGFTKENQPINAREKIPDVNSDFSEEPSLDVDEKDNLSFTSKLAGLNSSDADHSTPNMKFVFSNDNLFCGVDKLGNVNTKSLRGYRSKKKTGKLRERAMVKQLFDHDYVSKEGKTPEHGSPMDFSPYQDTSNVKAELAANEKDNLEQSEKPVDDGNNSNFSPSLPEQDGLSSISRQYKKKYKLKVGLNHNIQGNNSDKENFKQAPKGASTHEVCEHWRIRGNQAYHAGKLSKAEEFYTMGIDHACTLGYSIKPLLLCYSNRAATRMSLGRMREAVGDCTKAAALDPNFLKVTLRAGNCYLVLGEVEDAIQCYNKCLELGGEVCLDRRITFEAADGLQKAKRVAEYINQSAKLLQEGIDNSASIALGSIEDALLISRYSEKLLKMKGEALCMLSMYDEVIQLCEQTLDCSERNFIADQLDDPSCIDFHVKLWRWQLQAKSHYHLGRLDSALDLIEQQERVLTKSKSGDVTRESSTALAATIRELLCLKKSGNEAFNSGRFTEAVEHYTAAISKSVESRPFMAICFGNRAAAYQSINQIVDAIADCSLAIALDKNYQKVSHKIK